jgi:hypothetical protein
MTYSFFIDECLSPELVQMALDAGHSATCSRDRHLLGLKDWKLIQFVVAGDHTFVTNNACDFRGDGASDPSGLHAQQSIHAGLICLISNFPMDLERQRTLFGDALAKLAQMDDLINKALEVFEDENGEVTVTIYKIPDQDV